MNNTLTNLPDLAALEQALGLAKQIETLYAKLHAALSPATPKRKYATRKTNWWTPERRAAKARQMRRWHRENGG
jgi:hypothetical protein